jgi:chromate transport protein ChrA
MHRELVERRRWISDGRFLHALNYCMVLPGPEAQQLATYLGWLTHGSLGGIAAGLLFVLPSLLIMIGIGSLYVLFGQLPEVQALLYGVKPAVLAIVLAACLRLGLAWAAVVEHCRRFTLRSLNWPIVHHDYYFSWVNGLDHFPTGAHTY